MAISDNYALPTRQRLQLLINEQSSGSLKYGEDFLPGAPKPYGHGLRYNTSLVLYWQKAPHYGQAQRIFYRRLSLDTIVRLPQAPVFKVTKRSFHVNDILPLINAHYGTGFEAGDLVNDLITENDTLYECRAADTSLAWVGGKLPIGFEFHIDELTAYITVTQLDGLYPPTTLPAVSEPEVVAKVATPGIDSIWQ